MLYLCLESKVIVIENDTKHTKYCNYNSSNISDVFVFFLFNVHKLTKQIIEVQQFKTVLFHSNNKLLFQPFSSSTCSI